ncbi:MAG: hypothetical protein ACLFTH_04850 [Candidatus Woesearchaeota archaeon]
MVLIRGSTAYGEIKEYSDLDIEIYGMESKKPFYGILFYQSKIILLTIYFYKYEEGNPEKPPDNVRLLQGQYNDRIRSIFEYEVKKKDSYTEEELIIRKRQLFLDLFFEYMRSNDDKLLSQIQNKIRFKE